MFLSKPNWIFGWDYSTLTKKKFKDTAMQVRLGSNILYRSMFNFLQEWLGSHVWYCCIFNFLQEWSRLLITRSLLCNECIDTTKPQSIDISTRVWLTFPGAWPCSIGKQSWHKPFTNAPHARTRARSHKHIGIAPRDGFLLECENSLYQPEYNYIIDWECHWRYRAQLVFPTPCKSLNNGLASFFLKWMALNKV